MLSPRVLVLAVLVSSSSGCIPTVTPDDMYEDEMTTTFSSMIMTTSFTEPQSTVPTTTSSTTSTTTTTTTTTCGTCTCPTGGALFETTCYATVSASSDYSGTVMQCTTEHGAAATPAVITSQAENDFILNRFSIVPPAMRNDNNEIPWLYGMRATGSDPFMWADGTPMIYMNWVGGTPPPNDGTNTQLCFKMLITTGEWQASVCMGISGKIFCEYPATMSG